LKLQRTNLLGIKISTKVVQGKIHHEIDEIANQEKVDLVVWAHMVHRAVNIY